MTLTKPLQRLLLLFFFTLLMLATRSHHIATQLHLPDASVALFFLGGLLLQRRWGYLGAMMGIAAAIDYWAIGFKGVSSFCVTPAYLMLVPTYALLWCGGDWVARRAAAGRAVMPALLCSLLVTTFTANLISSGSFYFFSGRFVDTNILVFIQRIGQYAPAYIGYAAFYVGIATALYWLCAPQQSRQLLFGHSRS